MFPNRSELLDKIRLGEDSFLELKDVRFAGGRMSAPHPDSLADELAAFANSHGGVLVLGVDDKTREVLGIELDRLDLVETRVRELCQDAIAPPLAPLIERLTLPDSLATERPVLRIEVSRGLFVHQSPGGYLHRVGSSKRPMAPDFLARLFQQRSQSRIIRFDEQCVPGALLSDLDGELWERFVTERHRDVPPILLQKLAMACTDEDGVVRPSVAGILLACRDPRRFMSNAYIQAVAYHGTRISPGDSQPYQRDAQDICGPLDAQIFSACDFVSKNMRVAAMKGEGRQDVPQFDPIAVFEVVTNAVAHRDYSMYSSKVRLRLFDDRLELFSPGMLVNTMTVDSLRYRQAVRNETITSLLARCPTRSDQGFIRAHRGHVMDRRGEGIPIIEDRSLALSGKLPEFRMIDDSELLVTLYAAEGV